MNISSRDSCLARCAAVSCEFMGHALFDGDDRLQDCLSRVRKWATEKTLYELMDSQRMCTLLHSECPPSGWRCCSIVGRAGKRLDKLQRSVSLAVLPCLSSMIQEFRDAHDVEVRQGWGMTEMSPLGVTNTLKGRARAPCRTRKNWILSVKAGRGIFRLASCASSNAERASSCPGMEWPTVRIAGSRSLGVQRLLQAGWQQRLAHTDDGWFDTGDVATIDA